MRTIDVRRDPSGLLSAIRFFPSDPVARLVRAETSRKAYPNGRDVTHANLYARQGAIVARPAAQPQLAVVRRLSDCRGAPGESRAAAAAAAVAYGTPELPK